MFSRRHDAPGPRAAQQTYWSRAGSPECYLQKQRFPWIVKPAASEYVMERIRQVAVFCVGRAVFFGSLAVCCVMLSFAFAPVLALRAGAIMTLIMAGILLWKAIAVQSQNPKRTEVWLYLDEKTRPTDSHASFVFVTIMRDVYGRFAGIALGVACCFFVLSLVLMAFGLEPYQPPNERG